MKNITQQKGFTLIELLVVISIIGLLSSVVLGSLSTARAKGRDARRMQDLAQMRIALELYSSSNDGHYPLNLGTSIYAGTSPVCATAGATVASGLVSQYISKLPEDPKPVLGSCYYYYGDPDPNGNPWAIGYKFRAYGTIETFDPIAKNHPMRDLSGDPFCASGTYTPPIPTSALRRTLAISSAGAECI